MAFSTYQYARLVAAQITTATFTTYYTVPASTQAIIKTFTIANFTGTPSTVIIDIPGGIGFLNEGIPANTTLILNGLWVLNTGEIIAASSSVTSGVYLHVNGQTGQ
jgi:hypothetical protein